MISAAATPTYVALQPVNGTGPEWCDDYGNCVWAFPVTDPAVLQAAVFADGPLGEPPPTVLPTGTATFRERGGGLGTLGTVPLVNGVATMIVPPLALGHHSFQVDYSGDANFGSFTTLYLMYIRVTASQQPPSWRFEANDGPGNAAGSLDADVGAGASSVTYGDSPHVFYYDQDHGDLRHAWYSGGWRTETLDGAGAGPHGQINADVGAQTSALAYGGQLQVFYYDTTNGALRHAWWNGIQWSFEGLDGTAGAVANGSVTGDVGGTPATNTYGVQVHAYYYDATNGDLRHAWWNGVRWGSETLDGSTGGAGRLTADVGRDVGLALYEGAPHAWYQDTTNADLRHAWWNGTQWRFETLDGDVDDPTAGRVSGEVGQHPSVLVFAGSPHVWYHDASQGTLRHGWWTGARWQFEILDGWGGWYGEVIADVGEDSAAMLYEDTPHVWYRDSTFGYLRHGWWDGEGWSFEALDGYTGGNGRVLGDVGNGPTVLPFAGQPHVWYQDATRGNLRHAWIA